MIIATIIARSPELIATQMQEEVERIDQQFSIQPMQAGSLRVGAGGSWRVFGERSDRTVPKQFNNNACGEMLLSRRDRSVTQQEIAAIVGRVPMSVEDLAAALNRLSSGERLWVGDAFEIPGASEESVVRALSSTGAWAAVLWEEGASIGHMVVVENLDESGRLQISDPWGRTIRARTGSSYKMEMKEFLRVWNLQGVFLR